MKTNLELYRVVTGGYRWLQETPRRKCSFFVTNRQTLHHNIYIIITNRQTDLLRRCSFFVTDKHFFVTNMGFFKNIAKGTRDPAVDCFDQ